MGTRAIYCCGEALDYEEFHQYMNDGLCPECNVNWKEDSEDDWHNFRSGCGQFKIHCQGKEDCGIDDEN